MPRMSHRTIARRSKKYKKAGTAIKNTVTKGMDMYLSATNKLANKISSGLGLSSKSRSGIKGRGRSLYRRSRKK